MKELLKELFKILEVFNFRRKTILIVASDIQRKEWFSLLRLSLPPELECQNLLLGTFSLSKWFVLS